MRWKKAALTIGLVGAFSLPAAGISTAASAEPAAPQAAAAVSCSLEDFIGYYCGYHISNTYASRGDSGAKVKEIQALLIFRGFSVGSAGVDGQFGAGTESAVKRFQTSRGISADGIVGPTTWNRLRTP